MVMPQVEHRPLRSVQISKVAKLQLKHLKVLVALHQVWWIKMRKSAS